MRRSMVIVVIAGLLGACSSDTTPGPTAASTVSSTPATSTTSTTSPVTTVPVPAPYEQLVTGLQANLDVYAAAIAAMPDAPPGGAAPVNGAELLPANGNRLRQLLEPATMPAVDAWLDRFQAIGIRGVTLGIKIPMLLPEFGPDGDAYTAFFAAVADHARARGMTVDVELGVLFCNTPYAKCDFTFHGAYQDFVDATVAQARIVLDTLHPDLLTLVSEPSTEAALSGVHEFDTPAGTAQYVRDSLAGIGPHGSTKIGAGAATWLSPAFNEAILREAIDTLVLHIYPVSGPIADNLVRDTAMARQANRPIVADEIGLYKTTGGEELTPATADSIYRRDVFSFFQPLDVRFLAATSEWARKAGASYVSVFWAGQFFSYVDWTPELDSASFAQLMSTSNAAVSRAFRANELTEFGRTWAGAFR